MFLSVMPTNITSISLGNYDIVVHFVMYLILTLSICFTLSYLKVKIWFGVLVSCLFGILMELIQLLPFIEREFQTMDLIFNILGVVIGLLVFSLYKKIK